MDRLQRRILLLRGRRASSFDPLQYAREQAPRARAARQLRIAVQRGGLTVLRHPRWSSARSFIEDVALDLSIARRPVRTVSLDLSRGKMRRAPEAWSRVLSELSRALDVPLPPTAAWPVAREGFRHGLLGLLRRVPGRRFPLVVFCVGAQALPIEVAEDVARVWASFTPVPRGSVFSMVLAIQGDIRGDLPGAQEIDLPDFGPGEAFRFLVSRLGADDPGRLREVVEAVGGLPRALDEVASRGGLGDPSAPFAVRSALGDALPAMLEAHMIVCSDDRLADRVDALAEGALPYEPALDVALQRAGLIRVGGTPSNRISALRSPLLARIEDAME